MNLGGEKHKKGARLRQVAPLLFVFFLISSFGLFLPLKQAYATIDINQNSFAWTSKSTITVTQSAQTRVVTIDNFTQLPSENITQEILGASDTEGGYNCLDSKSNCIVMITSKSHTDSTRTGDKYYLVISKENVNKGLLFYSGSDPVFKGSVSITGADKVGLENIQKIIYGSLWGTISKSGDWATDFDSVAELGKVCLYEAQGSSWVELACKNIDKAKGKQADGSYIYERFTISSLDSGGLWEGKYSLRYKHEENADCISGDAKDGNLQLCPAKFEGDIHFNLTFIEDSRSYGYGKIEYIDNPGEAEKASAVNTSISDPIKGIFIEVGEDSDDIFGDAMSSALKLVGEFVANTTTWCLGGITWALEKGSNFYDEPILEEVSLSIRNLALGLLTLALLIIAFANILNINIGAYGLSKMIPKIVISIVMAFFSYLIALFLLEAANAITALAVSGVGGTDYKAIETSFSTMVGNNPVEAYVNQSSMFWQALLLILILLGMLLATLFLLLVLIVRRAILMLLIAVAPLAFILNIMPFTESYYKKWWESFWKWAYMGPPIALLYFLASKFITTGYLGEVGNSGAANFDSWIYLISAAVMIFMAATIPLKMGGNIYSAIQKQGGKAAGALGKKTGVSQALAERKASIDARAKNRGSALRANLALQGAGANSRLRRFAGGVDEQQAKALRMQTIKSMGETLPEDADALKSIIASTSGLKQEAALFKAASTGKLDAKDEITRAAVAEFADKDQPNYIAELDKVIGKENSDFFANAAIQGGVANNPEHFFTKSATAGLAKTPVSEYKPGHWNLKGQTEGAEAYHKIAKQKSTIDAALKGKPESVDAFVKNMAKFDANGRRALDGIEDVAQKQEILSRAVALGATPDTSTITRPGGQDQGGPNPPAGYSVRR